MNGMFGNCSELSALVFITGPAEKCLKSWLRKPRWKFLMLPCMKWDIDLHLIQLNKFESQINECIKERWSNYCVNIMWTCSNVINGLVTNHANIAISFLFPLGTSDAVILKCFYVWAMSIIRATLLWTVTHRSPFAVFLQAADGWT